MRTLVRLRRLAIASLLWSCVLGLPSPAAAAAPVVRSAVPSGRVMPAAAPGGLLTPAATTLETGTPAPVGTAPASRTTGILPGLRLAPATPGAVRFTVDVPEPVLTRFQRGQAFDRLSIDGFGGISKPGTPAIPTRVVLVAVPPLGDVRLTAAASEMRVRDGVTLEPSPALDAEGNFLPVERELASYGEAGSPVPVAARLLDVTWMRNQRVARVELAPVAYEPAARRLSIAGRIDVELAVSAFGPLGEDAEPVDGFESVYRHAVVNYDQGRGWRRPRTEALVAAAKRAGLPLASVPFALTPADTTSIFAGRTWIKISIQKTGFYAVNFSRLRGLSLFDATPAPFDSLRLFTWPGVTVLPENSYCDSCRYREVAIGIARDVGPPDPATPNVDGPADQKFSENNDTFYFYAQGPDGWESDQDATKPDTSFTTNPYERNNYYYLTVGRPEKPVSGATYPVGPQRIGTDPTNTRDVAVTGGETAVVTVPGRLHLEQDLEYWPDATAIGSTLKWEKWFWRSLISGNPAFVDTLSVLDADVTQPARFRLRQWGLSDNLFTCTNAIDHLLDVTVNNVTFPRRSWNGFTALARGVVTLDTTATFLRTTGNRISVTVPAIPRNPDCPDRLDRSGVAFYEIFYERLLKPANDAIEFRTRNQSGRFRYDIGPFVQLPSTFVFDITDPTRPVLLTNAGRTGTAGAYTLTIADTQSVVHRYAVVTDSSLTQTSALIAVTSLSDAPFTSKDNLRSTTNRADYLVIYYDGFKAAADSLVAWRTEHLPLLATPAPHAAIGVPVSALYDQFSGGRTDPGAIRSFLRAAASWAQRPLYVTFLGDASFDYKNITGRAPSGQPGCLLPTFENNFDNNFVIRRQYSTDDWMVNVDSPEIVIPDYLSGRIPAGDAASALAVVTQKVIGYERRAPFGQYRNAVVLLADDDVTGGPCNEDFCSPTGCDALGWLHVLQTNELSQNHTPAHIDREYVYLHTYPAAPGPTRPAARTDLFQKLDQGATIFNYVGHGSPFKMTDEGVFLDSDAGSLANGLKMPLMVAASCDVGKFNDPTVQSLGERIFMSPNAGCIAVLSATEQAISGQNSFLNGLIYDAIFDRDTLSVAGIQLPTVGQYHVPISAALLAAKSNPFAPSTNSQKYQLMGDPAQQLNLPKLWAELRITDTQGAPVTTMARGQTILFEGEVLDRQGGSIVPMDGIASMLIEDSAPLDRTDATCHVPVDYVFKAGAMYQGDVSVRAGRIAGRFIVPLDATEGSSARLRAYVTGRETGQVTTDGVGDVVSSVVPGTPPPGDDTGPRITLSFLGGSTNVRPDATLQIVLFDESGIMTTGHAPQNSIIVTLDGNTTSRLDVTSTFRYAADSYQSGTATFTLPNLAPGPHSIRVSAADNLATGLDANLHRSTATIDFQVVDVPPLKIVRTYMFPNPIRSGGNGSGGVFVVDAPGDSVNTLIRVYTVTGKLVRELRQLGGLGQVQMVWDGLDAEGDPLAQGTYLYKVHVSVRDADGKSSPRQRAASEGRFVVLSP